VEKIETAYYVEILFPENHANYEIKWKLGGDGQATDEI
jgi:hypothetical protein